MSKWRTYIAWLCLVVPAGTLQARIQQAELQPSFERVQGLSQNTVISMLQDREGYLWVGTSDGLNRYDGYTFTFYRHDPRDTTSLDNNIVKVLLEDRLGTLWVGTDGGLNRYDRTTDRFARYRFKADGSVPERRAVLQMLEDRTGRVWVRAGKLYRYDPATRQFTAYEADPGDPYALSGTSIWSLYEDREGVLWVVTEEGVLHRYDPDRDHFMRYVPPQSWPYLTIVHADEEGRLWLSGNLGTRVFDPATGAWALPSFISAEALIFGVMTDRQGRRWIGTEDGIYLDAPGAGGLRQVYLDSSPEAYLQNQARTFYQDRSGAVWVGTLSGLYRHDPLAKPFHHLAQDPTDAASLSDNTVMAVLEDRGGTLWLGTLGGGLNAVGPGGGVTHYRHTDGDPGSLCSDLIWALFEDRRGRLWVGTDTGLCWMDRPRGRFVRHDLPLDVTQTTQPAIHAIREDSAGALWVATLIGLYRLDPAAGAPATLHVPTDFDPSTLYKIVQALHVDRSGMLWIGVFGGNLYRLHPTTEELTRYPLRITDQDELVSEGIWAIHEDGAGALWLGSNLGLTRLDPDTGALTQYTQRDGLPGSIVYGILEDGQGRLWLSTNNGLVRFDGGLPSGRQFRNFDTGDGLGNTEFNRRAAAEGADGRFFFGGLDGLTYFDPAQVQENPYVPPVVLTGIRTSNRDTTIAINPAGLDRLVLSYRDYAVSFEFAALNFTNPYQNQYRYRLEGFDEAWLEAGTRRYASYTNLPAGDYTFRVRGSNDDGLWNEIGAALALTVLPPFWQTWWFRLLLACTVGVVLTGAYRYRVARLLEVERMRLRIAGDLHDEIGSNLSSIAMLSDIVQGRTYMEDRERHHLALISESARAMVGALRDIVWSIDPESERTGDLVQRLQDTAASMLVGVKFSFHSPPGGLSNTLDMNVRRHVLLGYKEMLHNIARHAEASEVSVQLGETKEAIVLHVCDDGTGFDEATVRPGAGLKHLQDRAERIGGVLDIDSRPGHGTSIRFVIPKPRRAGWRKKA